MPFSLAKGMLAQVRDLHVFRTGDGRAADVEVVVDGAQLLVSPAVQHRHRRPGQAHRQAVDVMLAAHTCRQTSQPTTKGSKKKKNGKREKMLHIGFTRTPLFLPLDVPLFWVKTSQPTKGGAKKKKNGKKEKNVTSATILVHPFFYPYRRPPILGVDKPADKRGSKKQNKNTGKGRKRYIGYILVHPLFLPPL